jgi:hypothetical protein
MNYDQWKQHNPADAELGNTHDDDAETAQCDCCARMVPRDEISRCWAHGIETFACDDCRGWNK